MPIFPNPYESRRRSMREALVRLPKTLGESALVLAGVLVGTAQHVAEKGQKLAAKGVEKYFDNEYGEDDNA